MSRIAKGLVLTSVAAAAVAGASGIAAADSGAHGVAAHSPGVLSGNVVQVPVHIPVNVCGNTDQRHRPAEPGVRQHLRQRLTSPRPRGHDSSFAERPPSRQEGGRSRGRRRCPERGKGSASCSAGP